MDDWESADRIEPVLAAEPTESRLATDPADPIDRIEPRLAIDRNESWDRSDISLTVIIVARCPRRGRMRG